MSMTPTASSSGGGPLSGDQLPLLGGIGGILAAGALAIHRRKMTGLVS
jgi:hypothetical protein